MGSVPKFVLSLSEYPGRVTSADVGIGDCIRRFLLVALILAEIVGKLSRNAASPTAISDESGSQASLLYSFSVY